MLLSPIVEKHFLKKDKQAENVTASEVQKEDKLSDELIDNNKE